MIIFLTGKKHSGKDFIADFLIEKYNFKKIAFADSIKHKIKQMFNFNDEQIEWLKYNKLEHHNSEMNIVIDGRTFVREIGMLMQSYDKYQFINEVKKFIDANLDKNIVITDLRFLTEKEFYLECKQNYKNVFSIKVLNEKQQDNADNHISETLSFDTDFVVHNNNNKEDLYLEISKLIEGLQLCH